MSIAAPIHSSVKGPTRLDREVQWGRILLAFNDYVSKSLKESEEEWVYINHNGASQDLGFSLPIIQHIFYHSGGDSSYNATRLKKSNFIS